MISKGWKVFSAYIFYPEDTGKTFPRNVGLFKLQGVTHNKTVWISHQITTVKFEKDVSLLTVP
jgi:hypothetical protein